MKKGNRLPERLYALAMWAVSAVFALFLVGLGGLVINDLPRKAGHIAYEPVYPAEMIQRQATLRDERAAIAAERQIDDVALEAAQSATRNAREGFQTWLETRKATTDPRQDTELLARTAALERLQQAEHEVTRKIEALDQRRRAYDTSKAKLTSDREGVEEAYRPVFQRAVLRAQLRVFVIRLAFTLPLLLLATWLVMRKRQSQYWPLYRGFVLASLYAFFVELVPYLPSYGGYIRYGVGALLTVLVCVVLIRNMQSYLARRRAAEAESEKERRQRVDRAQAYAKLDRKTCPDCDRPLVLVDRQDTNFCVHCGLTLYEHCGVCQTRNIAFNRFCMSCGSEDIGHAEDRTSGPSAVPVL
ncbi:zinc ribbon domain-containing protein [Asaia sp. VD9]|uniref:zinc ribbon domain-containing protein n=1 Tax=Asaia sp. VD9 TaxID=3081235 RepID=UPI00301ADD6E